MAKKKKRFIDDGWAVWVDGDDTSTVYINDWLNPDAQSYVDIAVRVRGFSASKALHVYVPFEIKPEEIEDVTLKFHDKKVLQAIFSSACIVDFCKNEFTSEVAYNGKTIDIVHIGLLNKDISPLSGGTIITVDFEPLRGCVDNDEVYLAWRMPHKSLNEIFKPHTDAGKILERARDLITTPVRSEKYGYSIRINESRRLPEEINRIGAFHRQKLKKAVVSISIDENYEMADSNCYRISRLEEDLYRDYLPKGYKYDDAIIYQWNQTRDDNLLGHFNFYSGISRESISKASMTLYIILIVVFGVAGEAAYDLINFIIGLI